MGLLGFGSWRKGAEKTLRQLAQAKTPVLVEVERSNVHFRTTLAVRGRAVILARPRRMGGGMKAGSWLRFRHPEDAEISFRIAVVHPHFLLSNGSSVIVADLPDEFAQESPRQATRFDTARFHTVFLRLHGHELRLPVVDLSAGGCRVRARSLNVPDLLPLDEPVGPAELAIGKQVVALRQVTARVYRGGTVGCAFRVANDGLSPRVLNHFLQKIEQDELKRLRAEPAL